MPFSPDTQFGPYKIVALIGSGGMGEVYKARDTRLERTVAIKILPAEFSADSDRLHRFEREARTASALNHPNIVTIYELGHHGSTHYIAMELVEGKTLREMLAEGDLLRLVVDDHREAERERREMEDIGELVGCAGDDRGIESKKKPAERPHNCAFKKIKVQSHRCVLLKIRQPFYRRVVSGVPSAFCSESV